MKDDKEITIDHGSYYETIDKDGNRFFYSKHSLRVMSQWVRHYDALEKK